MGSEMCIRDSVGCRGIPIYFNRDVSQELGSQAVTTGLDFRLFSSELKEFVILCIFTC